MADLCELNQCNGLHGQLSCVPFALGQEPLVVPDIYGAGLPGHRFPHIWSDLSTHLLPVRLWFFHLVRLAI